MACGLSQYRIMLETTNAIVLIKISHFFIQKLFVSAGGELRDEHPVTEIVPGDVITIKTTKGDFRTKKLVITAGAWAPSVLKKLGIDLPVKVSTLNFY